jgi:hypothetical protein
MKRTMTALTLIAACAFAGSAWAQGDATDASSDTLKRAYPAPINVQHFRPHDQRGVGMFEAPKEAGVPYTGFKFQLGAAFTQQFQALHHSNEAVPVVVPPSTVNQNQLIAIGSGFNNAVANLYLDAQLARGIRVENTIYLSSRHHQETWVKDGYLLIDGSPWENETLDNLMKILTLRVGHFEINYGDAHFRRTDNGNAMFNPLVGNYLMDAFTTEIGAELYARKNGLMLMAGATGGEIRGQVTRPGDRAPSYLAKAGFDRQVNPDLRARLTASLYQTQKSVNNTLYSGSRAGSRYYMVGENTVATENGNAWSGDIRPGFGSKVRSVMVNPFVKWRMIELFGIAEQTEGRNASEVDTRKWTHLSGEAILWAKGDKLYLAGRYSDATGRLAGMTADVGASRTQAGGGWFLTQNIEMKAEYVFQAYRDFPANDIRSGLKFEGAMVEGVVSF